MTDPTNPYTVREAVGFWLVLAPDGRTLAQCPSEDTARQIAAALWASVQRTRP